MAKKHRPNGICHICGEEGPLSFEHIPPKAAFNDRSVIGETFERILEAGPEVKFRGPICQKGHGRFTLCEACNNNTGSWYGPAFVEWCHQGMEILHRSGYNPRLIYLHYVYPLRVIKQIYVMAFSVNSSDWRIRHPELEQFVMDRERRWLNPRYRVFVYYNFEGPSRFAGEDIVKIDLLRGFQTRRVTEWSFPPYGYVVTTDGTCPDPTLFEITYFRRYDYNDVEVAPLYLPVLPTHLPLPLDYRSKEEIIQHAENQMSLF